MTNSNKSNSHLNLQEFQENNSSTFTYNGITYNLDKIRRAVTGQRVQYVDLDDLKWILQTKNGIDAIGLVQADPNIPIIVTQLGDSILTIEGIERIRKAINDGIHIDVPVYWVSNLLMSQSMIKPSVESFKPPSFADW